MSTKVANLSSVGARPSRLRSWRLSIAGFPLSLKIGAVIITLVALAGIFAPVLTIYNPIIGDFRGALLPPSIEHPFGTDNLGRDVFARVLYGARIDLLIGLIATYVPFVYGVAFGAMAGYLGGAFDSVLMRLVDVIIAFPFMIIIIVIMAVLGPGLQNMFIAVFVAGWTIYARLSRAEMLVIREQEYILAARALGYGRIRIIFRHAMPNLIQSSLVFSMSDFVLNILLVASLSYFGIGIQPPAPEWGAIITDGRDWLLRAWWISTLPGLAIIITGVGLSLIGDGLGKMLGQRNSHAL